MHPTRFLLAIVCWGSLKCLAEGANFSGRSYYFKTNGNNAFTVYNRIHFLNHNISDFDANPHAPQNLRNVKETGTNTIRPLKAHFFLDEEWNYEHRPCNKSNLPVFIERFYQQRLREPNKTDTLRIYFNKNRNTTSSIIKFDLSSTLRPGENVTDADMYFYWPLENSSSIFKTSVVLRLYQFEKQFNNDLNESNLVENPDIHKLFNVIYVAKAQKGWQTFKIKKPIDNWASGEENLGLLLTISSYEENKLISVFNDTNEGVFRTFAVLHIPDKKKPGPNKTQATRTIDPKTLSLNHACSKRPWHVDFQLFHWNDLVLYPENGFAAYQCSGKCHVANDDNHNQHLNNHVKLRHGYREKVCCVPTEYLSYPLMFVDRSGNVVLKNYDDMIVQSCGCR